MRSRFARDLAVKVQGPLDVVCLLFLSDNLLHEEVDPSARGRVRGARAPEAQAFQRTRLRLAVQDEVDGSLHEGLPRKVLCHVVVFAVPPGEVHASREDLHED